MKIRNKKTGEIPENIETITYIQWSKMIMMVYINNDGERILKQYNSLETFNAEWEDALEEPKEYWWIDTGSIPMVRKSNNPILSTAEDIDKEIGNYFETKEEAEKAVKKLKAWKRLKDDYHIRFDLDFVKNTISFTYRIDGTLHSAMDDESIVFEDMKTIFGGEE
jgi:hypothetical protein